MKKPLTFALLFAVAGLLLLGDRPVEAQVFSLDAATAPANLVAPDDLLGPGPGPPPPLVLAGGAGIGIVPVDVDAMSFGTVFPGVHTVVGAQFSVAPGTIGVFGTAVFAESGGVGFLDEPADIFGSGLGGWKLPNS
jgi:hypothetical protein